MQPHIIPTSTGAMTTGARNHYIGRSYANDEEGFNGKVKNFYLYNRELTGSEIQNLYTMTSTPSTGMIASEFVSTGHVSGGDWADTSYNAMTISNSGNVGMGATSPDSKLEVSGESIIFNPAESSRKYSSVYGGSIYHNSMLNNSSNSWVPTAGVTDDFSTHWTWIDLGSVKLVSGVITQKSHGTLLQFITSMKIKVSNGTATGADAVIQTTNHNTTDNLSWGDGTTSDNFINNPNGTVLFTTANTLTSSPSLTSENLFMEVLM